MKAIILAAGEGKRMNSKLPKVLHKVLGKTMISHVITTAKSAGALECVVVVGHMSEKVESGIELEFSDIGFVEQQSQQGTGHAVMMAERYLDDESDILILYGDVPTIRKQTIESLRDFHIHEGNSATVASTYVEDATGYGRIVRKKECVSIIEHKDAQGDVLEINEINTGIYIFKGSALKRALKELKPQNAQGEYYLTDTIEILSKMGEKVSAKKFEDASEFLGVNDRIQLSDAIKNLQSRINKQHMLNGVTVIDPSTTYISTEVTIGMDTIIYPNSVLEGKTEIGENCKIGPNAKLNNTTLKDGVVFEYSVCTDSTVGSDTTVGPFAYIRPNSRIGENCKIGDFVEVKNSEIGNNTKVSHLSYIGDSDFGNNINVGCGTVTVNYNGKKKYRTKVEDDAFIGCNANLIAPVTVKREAFVAAGSTVTEDVPEKSLAIARAHQCNKQNWSLKP